jgi:hypothetical protein
MVNINCAWGGTRPINNGLARNNSHSVPALDVSRFFPLAPSELVLLEVCGGENLASTLLPHAQHFL